MVKLDKPSWVFTFGSGQQYEGKCVRVFADDFMEARQKMIDRYGIEWGFQYSSDEWEEMRNDPKRYWDMEEEIESIV